MTMFQRYARIVEKKETAQSACILVLECPEIANCVEPGQFINVRVGDSFSPLWRRPFSVMNTSGNNIEILFKIVGKGTNIIFNKRINDVLDIIGPLGKPFNYTSSFETAILVGGGMGIAPFPLLTKRLKKYEKKIYTFIGAQTKYLLPDVILTNPHLSTDDGTAGFKGTVVQLLENFLQSNPLPNIKIFGCGPNAMMEALSKFSEQTNIECELSLEGEMACGIGLCQGCIVELRDSEKSYALTCVEGPTFSSRSIYIPKSG